MEMPEELVQAFNDQITREFAADITYRQLAIEAADLNLSGMASWLRAQADEEIVHANKFTDHVLDRGGRPQIGTIDAPTLDGEVTALAIFKAALEHEKYVSEAIRELSRTCEKAGDIDSRPLLQWFISEQIEEEATVSEIIGRIEIIKDDGPGLLRLDSELGARVPATGE